mgnify:CR=1 FL=1
MENNFDKSLYELHYHHYKYCSKYKKIVDSLYSNIKDPEDIYLHSSIFKNHRLISNPNNHQFQEYSSSGTSGKPSYIFFDRADSVRQQKVLISILRPYIPKEKNSIFLSIPFETSRNNARRAAERGFRLLSRKYETLSTDLETCYLQIKKYISDYKQVIIFGFTYELFLLFKKFEGLNLSPLESTNLYIIHGGGWKKLQNLSIDNKSFEDLLRRKLPRSHILNYYGMIEQTGIIYPRCELGYYHFTDYSKILIRGVDGVKLGPGARGMIQSISILPRSYPGHSILTQDLGMIHQESKCKCGRNGKTFSVFGRLNKVEQRGCSDAYKTN